MTIERAIEILDPEHREHYDSIETVNEACRMGTAALEKQRPKKPLVVREEYTTNFKCPDCGCRFISKVCGEYLAGFFYRHCYICGQAIDWRDKDVAD